MLIHELPRQGEWLFRRRSFVPLLLVPVGIIALLTHPHPSGTPSLLERLYDLFCLFIAFLGLTVRGATSGYASAGSSGRNTRGQIADHLNVTGPYSVVRHPLYLGNILIILGVLLVTQCFFFVLVGVLAYLLFYERIIAVEEKFLEARFGERYLQWAQRTPALLPRLAQWKRAELSFSFRAAVRGEFYGFTAIIAAITVIKSLMASLAMRAFHPDRFWLYLFLGSFLLFLILRHIRKHTSFFERADSEYDSSGV
ncbi:isoprenylcysteine carboxylmethyltransferase family protein [bacterium]|nr:isoprenylcysteine carboxylmethyltransferase family protein [bacterium]MBU1983136.1 isoprenylcysteine carboxylmethyltransferase family protein [bacterium]